MEILLSNDDGFLAPGINVLHDTLRKFANVIVVAPDRDRSGASNSLTLEHPLRLKQQGEQFFSVNGTPTDCVHLGLTGICENEPDVVISGINAGANLGDDILYSGTVAAAMEGRFLGYPSLAVSLTSFQPKNFQSAAKCVEMLINTIKRDPPADNMILNINVPDLPWDEIKGMQVTRLGQRHKAEPVYKRKDPRGETIYWVGAPGAEQDAGEGTDFYAINNGYISITPIHIDLTHYQGREQVKSWLNRIEK